MQRLVLPQSTPPLELLAETARQEVLEVVKPQHTLEVGGGMVAPLKSEVHPTRHRPVVGQG